MAHTPLTIEFLGSGTSTGIPMIACTCAVCTSTNPKDNRLRSSILVSSDTTTIVVDTTPDFRQQMLRIGNNRLHAVLFTHPHKDHIAGLDDIRAYNYFQHQAMDVYANSLTAEALKREFAYVFADKKYPGIPEINLYEIDETPFTIGDIDIVPFTVWHHKMPVYGYRFGKFVYITDANKIDPTAYPKIAGAEVLVLNALRHEKHISHFTLEEAVTLSLQLEVKAAYFTHISHQLGKHDDINALLPPQFRLAYDGLKILV